MGDGRYQPYGGWGGNARKTADRPSGADGGGAGRENRPQKQSFRTSLEISSLSFATMFFFFRHVFSLLIRGFGLWPGGLPDRMSTLFHSSWDPPSCESSKRAAMNAETPPGNAKKETVSG